MRGGSESQISDLTASVSGNFINLFKNLQYFGLQLHIAPCYISIIVSVFCNGQYIVHHTHPVIGSDPGTYYSDLYKNISETAAARSPCADSEPEDPKVSAKHNFVTSHKAITLDDLCSFL